MVKPKKLPPMANISKSQEETNGIGGYQGTIEENLDWKKVNADGEGQIIASISLA